MPDRFPPPYQALKRKTLLERAVHALEHRRQELRQRLADGRSHDRKQDVGEGIGVGADRRDQRILNRRRERLRQGRIVGAACCRFGQHVAHVPTRR